MLSKLRGPFGAVVFTILFQAMISAACASTGITAVDNANGAAKAVVIGLAGFFVVVLIAAMIFEFQKHKNMAVMGGEFVAICICGVVAANADAVMQKVGITGALLH